MPPPPPSPLFLPIPSPLPTLSHPSLPTISPQRPQSRTRRYIRASISSIQNSSPVPVSTELQTFLSTQAPPKPNLHPTTAPPEEDIHNAEAVYRTAKEQYRHAKALYKASDNDPSLENAYRSAKARYKEAKARYKTLKALHKMRDTRDVAVTEPLPVATVPRGNGVIVGNAVVCVCGGKSCTRMGAHAVADVVRRKRKDVTVLTDQPCMKMCGGRGPSLRVGDRVVKVDLVGAVEDAVGDWDV